MKRSWEVAIMVILSVFLITGLKCQQEIKKEKPVVTQQIKKDTVRSTSGDDWLLNPTNPLSPVNMAYPQSPFNTFSINK